MKIATHYSWLSPFWWLYRWCISLAFGFKQQHQIMVEGRTILFDTRDSDAKIWFFPRYFKSRIHEAPVTKTLLKLHGNQKVFFDVGANLGWYSCVAGIHFPKSTIVAFEMASKNVDLLQKNIRVNTLKNVASQSLAVTEVSGQAHFASKRFQPGSLHRIDTSPKENTETVSGISLDDFCQMQNLWPNLVKIDVEGAEMLVLKGMKGLLAKPSVQLLIEVHSTELQKYGSNTTTLLNYLFEVGYLVYEICDFRSRATVLLRSVQSDSELPGNAMLLASKKKVIL